MGEDYLSSLRFREDHANARSGEVGSGWSFELRQENHRCKAIDDCKKFLPDCSHGEIWFKHHWTMLKRRRQFQC